MTKTTRIEIRTDSTSKQRLEAAADFKNESVSQFVLAAAVKEADAIFGAGPLTVLPADQFDALLGALDEPARNIPELAEAANQQRRFRRV